MMTKLSVVNAAEHGPRKNVFSAGSSRLCTGSAGHNRTAESGSTLIELALLMPVITLMLLGALDVSMVLQWSMQITDSLRAGAQYATLSSSTLSGVKSVAQTSATGVPGYSVNAVDSCLCGSAAGASACSGGTCTTGSPINYVVITATASLPLLFGVQGLPANIPVSQTVRIRAVGGA